MNLKSEVRIKKPALTPALSPGRGRNGFRVRARSKALDSRWFMGSMREILIRGNLSPLGRGEGVENRVKMSPLMAGGSSLPLPHL